MSSEGMPGAVAGGPTADRSADGLTVAFHGVRGSTPCSCPSRQRYGGNTSCVSVESLGTDPIVLDLGTGLRQWGASMGVLNDLTVHALVSHLHWDHIQGLPFFAPLQQFDTDLKVYGPGDEGMTMAQAFELFMSPPFFPIRPGDLVGNVDFIDTRSDTFAVDDAKVTVRQVPHTGPTNGYRIERNNAVVAYVSDHQQPDDGSFDVDPDVLELVDGADLLIHDAQFTDEEFAVRSHWGHCTVDYALEVARRAGAKALALFHHDPGHTDDDVDRLYERAAEKGAAMDIVVHAAAEGMKLDLGTSLA